MRKKERIWRRVTAWFFGLMVLFTLISRWVWQRGTLEVETAKPQSRPITHQIRVSGRVVENRDLAVVTEPNQRVKAVYVSLGQKVREGDLLFALDTELLEEQIVYAQEEMEKAALTAGDAQSHRAAAAAGRANEQAAASESYALNVARASEQFARADAGWKAAKKKLAAFDRAQRKASDGGEETKVAARLEGDVEESAQAYIDAKQAMVTLQWRIEAAVEEAIRGKGTAGSWYANAAAGIETEAAALTQSADWEETVPLPEQLLEEEGWDDALIEDEAPLQETLFEETLPSWADDPVPELAEQPEIDGEALSQIERQVRDSYASQLSAAQKKVESALAAYNAAKEALDTYREEHMSAMAGADDQTRAQLAAAVQTARENRIDAALTLNEARVTGGRGIATAALPQGRDSGGQIDAITRGQSERALEKLRDLAGAQGEVRAPCDGCITGIGVTAGEKTMDSPAVTMTDLNAGMAFSARISREQYRYIAVGDAVTLRSGGSDRLELTLPVTMIVPAADEPDAYDLTVQLAPGLEEEPSEEAGAQRLQPGAAMELTYESASPSYPVVVPVTALHVDDKNQTFVLVPLQEQTVMGSVLVASRTDVTVAEKNDLYAALDTGAVGTGDEIITSAGKKAVEAGKRIRIALS